MKSKNSRDVRPVAPCRKSRRALLNAMFDAAIVGKTLPSAACFLHTPDHVTKNGGQV